MKRMQWKHLSLKAKMLVTFFIVALLMCVGGAFIYMEMDKASNQVEALERRSDRAMMTTEIGSLIRHKYILVSDYGRGSVFDEQTYQQLDERLNDYFAQLENRMNTEMQQTLYQVITSQNARFNTIVEETLSAENDNSTTQFVSLDQIRKQMLGNVEELTTMVSEQAETAGSEALLSVEGAKTMFFISFGIAVLSGAVLFYFFASRISRQLRHVVTLAKKVSAGDLTVEKAAPKGKDEIGQLQQAMNTMVDGLSGLMNKISQTSEQLASSSNQLTASSDENSKASTTISESIQELASGIDTQSTNVQANQQIVNELNEGIGGIAKAMETVHQTAMQTSERASNGNEVVERTVSQMTDINQQTKVTSEVIQQLDSKSEKINSIVSLITDIADQTNLLALNAAIEAARAGENGKGFAVVADEVRSLAEQSTSSAGQISELIRDIQQDISQSVEYMSENRKQAESGLHEVQQAGEAFNDITESVQRITEQTETVSASVEQLTASTQEMVSRIDESVGVSLRAADYSQDVAASAEESNASMQEVAASAEALSGMAEELQESTRHFKV
ncbi:methyl-accepting chemotaxis protein [Alteribacillus persepolensis]|uniref:Methyl-accepting chemotaxis protein n=1 Tax=Alteribacillus persepolensis TaxID=568899 RepID=A0A1G8AI28_9BACI|nr:HAMP domain-containing methyl-accepting chemotaxis protein [Alteribacillus persepolensis]SDH19960.1 methyl-accepting chemotaxis protein [Alteribacillus persepolensis]